MMGSVLGVWGGSWARNIGGEGASKTARKAHFSLIFKSVGGYLWLSLVVVVVVGWLMFTKDM